MVNTAGKELRTFCVWTSKNDRKVSVVDPAAFPIYFGLDSCEPWVAEDGFVFTKVGEEELEGNCCSTGAYIQDGIVAKVSTSVFGSVDVEQFARVQELFDGEFKPFGVGEIHEVLGGS